MMTRAQLLFGKMAEEAAEIAQIALKAQQFGLDDVWEKVAPLTVRDRIHGELDDLLAVVGMLVAEAGLAYVPNPERQAAKVEKVNRYAALSVALGRVEGPAPDLLRDPDGAQSPVSWVCPTLGCYANHSHAEHLMAPWTRACPNCQRALFSDFLPTPF